MTFKTLSGCAQLRDGREGSRSRLERAQPNKRLKLAGGDRFKGSGVLCAGGEELSFNDTPRRGRVARSLSAIR